ncbi:peptidase C39 family protein [Nocardioides mangrovicus]|uniref:Peptidase C39 family protein n=1 Tax=Nocardioides mangrovicus TaxID=2478913 RepID=A0A3L8NYG3_9ACTN|nr:C39 family peptidase [Nocardioides mangrovicus]RLV47593.1 peptidase C39 family protein [Nocardioides mangrovicus]
MTGQNTYTALSSAAFGHGVHRGTAVTRYGRLKLASANGHRRVAGTSWATARWTSDWVTPGHAFTQLIPSWQAVTPARSYVQVSLRARTADGRVSSFDTIARWTSSDAVFKRTSMGTQGDDLARVNTDTFVAASGVQFTSWQVRLTLVRAPGAASPKVRRVGAVASLPAATVPATSTPLYGAQQLAVPGYSQMTHRGQYPAYGGGGEAWCSPTSTSMVLGYYGALPSRSAYAWVKKSYADPWVDHAARMTFDHRYDGTGNWPFNTAYAARLVDDAFVTRLSDLRDAERFVHAGIPLVVSISFSRGQLSGAPISATAGHLVVITGFTASGSVVVNDPAAPSNASVSRTYDRGQFERAWLTSSKGAAYVIRDAAHALPAAGGSGSSW